MVTSLFFKKKAIIKLIAKKDRDKRFVKNWQPISLLNADTKILSKSLVEKLKNALPELVYSNQIAYVKNWCISESRRLISDVILIGDLLDIPGYLVTMVIEKAFDSSNLIRWSWISVKCFKNIWFWSQFHTLGKTIIK